MSNWFVGLTTTLLMYNFFWGGCEGGAVTVGDPRCRNETSHFYMQNHSLQNHCCDFLRGKRGGFPDLRITQRSPEDGPSVFTLHFLRPVDRTSRTTHAPHITHNTHMHTHTHTHEPHKSANAQTADLLKGVHTNAYCTRDCDNTPTHTHTHTHTHKGACTSRRRGTDAHTFSLPRSVPIHGKTESETRKAPCFYFLSPSSSINEQSGVGNSCSVAFFMGHELGTGQTHRPRAVRLAPAAGERPRGKNTARNPPSRAAISRVNYNIF